MAPKILLLADINSAHIQKWVLSLANDNFQIGIFSFNASDSKWFSDNKNIICLNKKETKTRLTLLNKLAYLLLWPKLIYQIYKFKPQVIHSHYASSYGLLGALTLFKPFIVSAWGSDVMDFPKKNLINKLVMKFILFRANKICVTSTVLKKEISFYTKKQVCVIPFGVNLNIFYATHSQAIGNHFIFGIVKNLEPVYNIDKTIIAFYSLIKRYPDLPLKLKIIGDGSQKENLIELINYYGLQNSIEMLGYVAHDQIPLHLNTMDVLVNVSEIESFGVSVAEAMACQIPVIVSDLDGFKDLIPDESVGLITRSTSPYDIHIAMEKYLMNNELRNILANNAFQRITEKFSWNKNLDEMEKLYFEMA
ncbi:MAG: glycosyltransferase [Bacteroidetes bacterium]|nr:glycosyltransferase [Bacteroidota bacterium]